MGDLFEDLNYMSCTSLVLGFEDFPLTSFNGRNFYIPDQGVILDSFDYALREVFKGEWLGGLNGYLRFVLDFFKGEEEIPRIPGRVNWSSIENLDCLSERILRGVKSVTEVNGESASYFEEYLTPSQGPLEMTWKSGKGHFYRFEGKKSSVWKKYYRFWERKELIEWMKIHDEMNNYVSKVFNVKV